MPAPSRPNTRAINDKVRLYARFGATLIAGRDERQDGYDAIIALILWVSTLIAGLELAKMREGVAGAGEGFRGDPCRPGVTWSNTRRSDPARANRRPEATLSG